MDTFYRYLEYPKYVPPGTCRIEWVNNRDALCGISLLYGLYVHENLGGGKGLIHLYCVLHATFGKGVNIAFILCIACKEGDGCPNTM